MKELHEYITESMQKPFKWGEHDCVLFAANWVKVATGVDYTEGLPSWSGARQAMKLVEKHGGIQEILDKRFNQINPNLAKDGDLCIYNGSVCIFSGAYVVGTGEAGLEFIDRTEICCAWSL